MKDVIYVEHKNFVSVKGESLCFKNVIQKTERYLPFEDISMIIFDNVESYFSNAVINICVEHSIGILFCDNKHSPIAAISSNFCHSKKLERLNYQLCVSQKTKNRLWRKIIVSKINNQSECLIQVNKDINIAEKLSAVAKNVKEGDIDNREAYAANIYFDSLFGEDFKRGRYTDFINSGLNYGYALCRALIRKELAICGFEMSFGIFHKSSENPFNLSDDIIEAFRPFVDAIVYEEILVKKVEAFGRDERKSLTRIFFEKCVIDNKVYTITDAVKICVSSLIACYEKDSASNLKLPSFIELGK